MSYDKIRTLVPPKAWKHIKATWGTVPTYAMRLEKIRQMMTGLFRYERIECHDKYGLEIQQYTELLLQEAIKYGPRHKPTMETVDFYMIEKDLVHKTFKLFVPRFARFEPPYTKIHFIPTQNREIKRVLLELKGNPFPPVEPRPLDRKGSLVNILLAEAKRDYVRQKVKAESAKEESRDAPVEEPVEATQAKETTEAIKEE
ncbi:hypothetical protein RvY_12049 [Ramazzottius varieornatus]|uniref:Large ribosomal subunit protein bL17m n=1 Tax=Ramazzottius varieornatus TaxID=947166 RepID=A0A1D1VI55_RAMVA|nr:hypothetical protein RvY_12049 [Ramazzottius varieornatus]